MPNPARTSASRPSDRSPGQHSGADQPATFREVFALREFKGVFGANIMSWLGDFAAKAAVAALVFRETQSTGLAAAAFAISYAPWVLIGPLLATYADRHPYRAVMVVCNLFRMVTIAAVAIPGMPIAGMVALLFLTSLGNPPYNAARSALMPSILAGDRLVVGISISQSTGQAAQIAGYLAGGVLAGINPRYALLFNAAMFGMAALLLTVTVHKRPAAHRPQHPNLVRETADGFRMVFGTDALRGIALLIFALMLSGSLSEGLAAGWAAELTPSGDSAQIGFRQALIMLSLPAGAVIGGLLFGRLTPPAMRPRIIRPLAVLAPLMLVPAVFDPPLEVVLALSALSGCFIFGVIPTANAMFVRALPDAYRARAFGVVTMGMMVLQGSSIMIAGAIANARSVPVVVGYWSLAGAALLLVIAIVVWPAQERFAAAIERARKLNEAPSPG